MKVRLLEDAHKTWAPAGTVGDIEVIETIDSVSNTMSKVYYGQFRPDNAPNHPLWIGQVKWEEVVEPPRMPLSAILGIPKEHESQGVKPSRRRR